jgi:glycosyltransferase involved in cell wall biosynthesis
VLREIVICSLERWDEVWRRNQFFVDSLLRHHPRLRVLFVEPSADVVHDMSRLRLPKTPRLRTIGYDGRLRAIQPTKLLPRRLGTLADRLLLAQVRRAARRSGFDAPLLWINDITYAPLIEQTGWRSVYDVTDDWLLAPFPPRQIERLRYLDALALAEADAVVVCSPALAASRGSTRDVALIPNGVDVEHFRRPRPRPPDLPPGPCAVYLGTLHETRLDVQLVRDLAVARPTLNIALVGPVSLGRVFRRLLDSCPNVRLLGPRPYAEVPAYLQHADVIIVPHIVSSFTESLDPIKAYECLAVETPTVATPVAGFRELVDSLTIAERGDWVQHVGRVLEGNEVALGDREAVRWETRAEEFAGVLERTLAPTSTLSGLRW